MNVLILTDDESLLGTVDLLFRAAGNQTLLATSGDDGKSLAENYPQDLILCGDTLTDMSGLRMLKQLRYTVKTPIIVLSGDPSLESKAEAFRAGADDYVVTPFHRDELLLRSEAIVRRANGHGSSSITVGKLEVDLHEKRAKIDGRIVPLTGKEFQMLELLTLRRGTCVTKEAFMHAAYGLAPDGDWPEIKIIDVFLCKVRRKLRDFGAGTVISTVWGRGYMIDAEPTAAAA